MENRENWAVIFNNKSPLRFDLLWDVNDNGDIYDTLFDDQLYNHFPNNSELTSKAGLAK